MPDVEIKLIESGWAELVNEQPMYDVVLAAGDNIAEIARHTAPRKTGAGADSIHTEMGTGDNGWEGYVTWDPEHDYMAAQHSAALQNATATLSHG